LADWKACSLLFQLTNDEIPSLMLGQQTFSIGNGLLGHQIESFVFLAIELNRESWSRTAMATITRELNRQFPMPAIVLFRHGSKFSLAVIDRRLHKRDASRDVLTDRISIVKDVRLDQPHTAHVHILAALAVDAIGESGDRPDSFTALYKAWLNVLSVQELNKRFYRELACWYFWAIQEVRFPDGAKESEAVRNATGVIRLITRLIFVWFIRERGLVPNELFQLPAIRKVLKQAPDNTPEESTYYKAILQNLFFATLNTEMGERRRFRGRHATGGRDAHYGIHNVYRYAEAFSKPDEALALFKEVPLLNGGLFECLDKVVEADERKMLTRIDGFSDRVD
jgi:adenine-specific DNA-methyltransferase